MRFVEIDNGFSELHLRVMVGSLVAVDVIIGLLKKPKVTQIDKDFSGSLDFF